MANHTGNEGSVYTGANATAEIRRWELTEGVGTVDDTTMGDTAETHKVIQTNWTASVDALWDETDTTGQGTFTIGSSHTLNLYPEGNTTGDTYFTGTATVESVRNTGSHDGLVEATFGFKGNGALTRTTVA